MRNKSYFKERKKSRKPITKAMLYIIIALFVLVPAILALTGYLVKSNNIVGANSLKVSLYYNNALIGEQSDDPQNKSADELVLIFDDMVNRMKQVESLPNDLSFSKVFNVRLETRTDSYDYTCYFSFNNEIPSYCVDRTHVVYEIPKETADAFLSSVYTEHLYSNANAPKMYSSSDEEILPESHEWYYKTVSGEYREASDIKTPENVAQYNMSGVLGLTFDTLPDECNVTIYKSGIKIYSGTYEALADCLIETGTTLKFEVSAYWNETQDRDFCGTVEYRFDVLVRDRASFLMDKNEVTQGDLVLVSCTNVLDETKVDFISVPSINVKPIFVSDNGMVRTMIPISSDLKAGEYELTFSYGASIQTLVLTVNDAEKPRDYTLKAENAALLSNVSNEKNLDEVTNIIKSLSLSDKIFMRNEFFDYTATGAEAIAKFGSLVTTNSGSVTHTVEGTQYVWKENGNEIVSALNSGVVVKVGNCTYLGDYVIVDHGLGLRTVYSHLNEILVKERDTVLCGQMIGLCGSLDIVSPSGVFVMCFVYDVAIDYDRIAGTTLPFYYVQIEEEE